MNKKILVGIVIAIIAISVVIVGAKNILGDKATELPGEEHTEKILSLQEMNKTTTIPTGSIKAGSAASGEAGESGP